MLAAAYMGKMRGLSRMLRAFRSLHADARDMHEWGTLSIFMCAVIGGNDMYLYILASDTTTCLV